MNPMIQFIRQMSERVGSGIYAGVQGHSNPHHMSFLRQIQKEIKEKNSLDLPLKDLKVVVFDLETTGFSPEKGDQIISIGAIKMTGDTIEKENTFYSLVNSDAPLSDEIVKLTNITKEQIGSAPSAYDVLIKFFQFINESTLVAHHAKHEQTFMQRTTWDLMRIKFEHRIVDTSFLIRIEDPYFKNTSLEECCENCGVDIVNRHHALGDAKMTAEIWSYYIKKALNKNFKTLRDVYEHIATFPTKG